ncbi:MAG: MerR family transcriptional regulator [Pseudomonadota bacterium]
MISEESDSPDTAELGKTFRIGTVSRITQIPVDTLRAWERRYGVVSPNRDVSSARLFNQQDIERLQLIKQLVDAGHAISSVANLSKEELSANLELHRNDNRVLTPPATEIDSMIVFREPEAHSLDVMAAETAGITVLAVHTDWREFEADITARKPGVIVVLAATLLADQSVQLARIARRLARTQVVVIYGFGPSTAVERLQRDGIRTLRAPIDIDQLLRELERQPLTAAEELPQSSGQQRRLFDDQALESLSQHSAAVQCECPHHLVDIVRTLNQFEVYSAECESRNDEDAALHARLAATTANARSYFESALLEVAKYEGIELPAGLAQESN